jgi:hypothetical protein
MGPVQRKGAAQDDFLHWKDEKAVRNRWLTNFQPGLVARNRRIWSTESAKSHEMWERKVLFMPLGEKIALLRR